MSSIGKFNISGTALQNENTVALVNNSLDFTLVKLTVPSEYNELGSTLSRKRKDNAEGGPLHKTARRLGELFRTMLPDTDDLFRAYGKRVSEISSIPAINPAGALKTGGIFASHVGADSTSIWAAATSGSAAIAVHLLACMLARIFTVPEAISTWVEIVDNQKEHIFKKHAETLYSHELNAEYSAARQDISRVDLSNWDASARAWLQSADEAKAVQHKQMMLILNNTSIPVNTERNTYSSVMGAWIAALNAMNSLIKGIPQRVQDGAILLGISSWHLYPDMACFGETCVQVKQKDPIFKDTALLTLGLHHVREGAESVFWSLPLACLQYYGPPVHTARSVGQENARISCDQFLYVVLGCLFDGWGEFAATNEDGYHWVDKIMKLLQKSSRSGGQSRIAGPSWLSLLHDAIENMAVFDDTEKRLVKQLVQLGRRKSTFLRSPGVESIPIFGFSQLGVLLPLLANDHERVSLLRQLSYYRRLDPQQFLIRYQSTSNSPEIEFATLAPVWLTSPSSKRNHGGHLKPGSHSQAKQQELRDWAGSERKLKQVEEDHRKDSFSDQFNQKDEDIVRRQTRANNIQELKIIVQIGQRKRDIEEQDEICLPAVECIGDFRLPAHNRRILRGLGIDFMKGLEDLETLSHKDVPDSRIIATHLHFGDYSSASVCFLSLEKSWGHHHEVQGLANLDLSAEFVSNVFNKRTFSHKRIQLHLYGSPNFLVEEETDCLAACAQMMQIYKLLPGATISNLVLDTPLSSAKWFITTFQQYSGSTPLTLTRSQAFACIAMFESGTCNMDPESLKEVFAMSSGNSLYVAGPLLCDPHEEPGPTEIRRVVGNIGRAGITFLIAPPEVNMRKADTGKWMHIDHYPFDGKMEDYFQQTSIHLSFTNYEMPLISESHRHIIDRAAMLVETLVSVYDGGEWVAELDILKAFGTDIHRVVCDTSSHKGATSDVSGNPPRRPHPPATSVKNWAEFIEAPDKGLIAVQAHKNWLARLAITAICARNQFTPIVLPEVPCWDCCERFIPNSRKAKLALVC
ncbi:hypothetical protein BGZ60DRAFT_161886 [Tricladium varicosporioides]|nr:hypothetical protein BGZ60DRAFT_161886 [Hymenoscyphus varicosporioides]